MSEFDVERGIRYFEEIKNNIYHTYVDQYGYSPDKAEEIAMRTAAKLLIRNIGPENAMKVLEEIKKRKGEL